MSNINLSNQNQEVVDIELSDTLPAYRTATVNADQSEGFISISFGKLFSWLFGSKASEVRAALDCPTNTQMTTDIGASLTAAKGYTDTVSAAVRDDMALANHNHDGAYNNYIHPADANTRHVTDAEKAEWNAKADSKHEHNGCNAVRLNHTCSFFSYLTGDGLSVAVLGPGVTERTGSYGIEGITLPSDAKMDMPGILAEYTVLYNGMLTEHFGVKASNAKGIHTSTGHYTIPHNIGHTQYKVQITLINAMGFSMVVARRKDAVDIEIANHQNAVNIDASFMITLTGRN